MGDQSEGNDSLLSKRTTSRGETCRMHDRWKNGAADKVLPSSRPICWGVGLEDNAKTYETIKPCTRLTRAIQIVSNILW